jgi:UTP:GlnB (protein PII) uridylyltransferase
MPWKKDFRNYLLPFPFSRKTCNIRKKDSLRLKNTIVSKRAPRILETFGRRIVNTIEKMVVDRFKALLLGRVSLVKMVLFGSRARGDAGPCSDMDVVVILKGPLNEKIKEEISEYAWQAGFEQGIVLVPVVFTQDEWENGPERHSLLIQAVEAEGVLL